MITHRLPSWAVGVLSTGAALLFLLGIFPAVAGPENTFQVQLVWGTDGDKPKDQPLKEIEPKLLEKLRGIFKWKNYFEVNHGQLALPDKAAHKLKLSEKCEIQAQDLGGSRLEIRLFGEGKLVLKKVQPIVPGETIILAGDSKNDTAWFVVLTPPKS